MQSTRLEVPSPRRNGRMKGKEQNNNFQRVHFQSRRSNHSLDSSCSSFSLHFCYSKKMVVLPSHTYQSTCLFCFRTKTLTNFPSPSFLQLWIISSVTTLFSSIFIQVEAMKGSESFLPHTFWKIHVYDLKETVETWLEKAMVFLPSSRRKSLCQKQFP